MRKITKLLCAGLLSFGLFYSVGLGIKANKQVQEVQATGESENPVATVDQINVVGATPNVTAGLTYADGVLTIDEDFPSSITELNVIVNTGGTKADLTLVINRKKPFDVVALCNQYGNLTVNCYTTLNIRQIYVLGNLTIRGTGIVLLNIFQPFPIPSKSMIYVEGKLVIEGNIDISGGLLVEYANSLISTKYLEVNTNNGININCDSIKPEFGAALSRYATICFHDCPNVDVLAGRLTLKHGKFILEKYYSEEDTQYNDKFGFVAWDENNGLKPFGTDHFDLENKLFTGYQIVCTNSELKVKTRNIDFEKNGGTGDSLRYGWYPIGSTITLPECPYTASEGQHFVGWALGSKTATPLKQPGETFVLEEGDDPSSSNYDYYSVYAIWEDEVIPTVLQSITLSGTHKTSFEVGDTFSYEGLIVTAHYNNKADTIIANGYNVSSPDMSTEGSKTVTVSYTEEGVTKTATYQITVTAKETPVTPNKNSGLPAGAIAGIIIGSVLVVGIGGFALVWFVIKKKSWADFVALFKKK